MKIGLTGASGTGKSTLAKWISEHYGYEINPIGSRTVAKEMGYDNPYDVDKAGKRTEFQNKLLEDKLNWEKSKESFVSDRTTFDNLVYATLHDIHGLDDAYINKAIGGMQQYDVVFYCPLDSFINLDEDPMRVSSMHYHKIYDAALMGYINKFVPMINVKHLTMPDLAVRKGVVKRFCDWKISMEK